MPLTELHLTFTLIVLFTVPGTALLAGTSYVKTLPALQRWILVIMLSVAFYPIFFYGMRTLAPDMGIFAPQLMACLGVSILWIGWRWRTGEWRNWVQLEPLEWLALCVFGATLFTRFWIIREQPYPAWSDSLHHVLLTQLTATRGALPTTLEPYAPIPLDQYHLGLYALSGSLQLLAQVPAHTALLWTAQALNGLCGIGLYFVLDQKVGRVGALVGAVVVGLLSHQPAWYVNWGRFTQMAGQVLLLVAWWILWETWKAWQKWPQQRGTVLWLTFASAVLVSGLALIHFRVAAFLAPLMLMSALIEGCLALRNQQWRRWLAGMCITGLSILALISPALWDALRVYTALSAGPMNPASKTIYFDWNPGDFPLLMAHPWLMWLAVASACIGLVRRHSLTWLTLGWLLGLITLGNAYLLGNRFLNLTNFSGVLILFYLPFGLLIGIAAESLLVWCGKYRAQVTVVVLSITLLAGFAASHVRMLDIEPMRYFVTPADLPAMDWINHNTSLDAKFAINVVFWFPTAPHGTDSGYWIPYFTGRSTNAVSMLLSFAPADYRTHIKEASDAVVRLETDISAVAKLKALGYDYVFIGARGNFARPGLRPEKLRQVPGLEQVYAENNVYIFAIR